MLQICQNHKNRNSLITLTEVPCINVNNNSQDTLVIESVPKTDSVLLKKLYQGKYPSEEPLELSKEDLCNLLLSLNDIFRDDLAKMQEQNMERA